LSEPLRLRTEQLKAELGELGVDPFGYDPEVLKYAAIPVEWLYRHYFRVETIGMENVPEGRVLLVANHAGQLPFDGMMLGASMMLDHDPPRVVRTMVEKFVSRLPFVSIFFARVGQIVGTPENCRRLLERGEVILVFPEGARGISKTFNHRYQLERFGHGFMRLALETKAPIVPVGIIGSEEQAMSLHNLKSLAKLLNMPAFPITPTFPLLGPLGLAPLPTKYCLRFGKPMQFAGHGDEEEEFIRNYVDQVKLEIEVLIQQGLEARKSIFRS
jgi:1-acyl-sn-glycerol-3-phosphate acyltransferase